MFLNILRNSVDPCHPFRLFDKCLAVTKIMKSTNIGCDIDSFQYLEKGVYVMQAHLF